MSSPTEPVRTPAFDLGRLRVGDAVAGLGAVVTFVALWLEWYSGPAERGHTAWQAFGLLDIWLSIAIAVAAGLVLATAARTSMALPVALSVMTTTVGGIAVALVAYRMVNPPGPNQSSSLALGAFVGLAGTALIAAGGWMSMRREQPGRSVRRRQAAIAIPQRPAPPPASEKPDPGGDATAASPS